MKTQFHPILAKPFKLVGQFFSSSQRRFRLSRPGSVLILCIALLVLLALIGTAMISTAGVDRYSSAQHTYNTQIDLLVDGVKAMAQSWVQNGVYQANTKTIPVTLFRPADQDVDQTGVGNYQKYDAITTGTCGNITSGAKEMWLAPRVPLLTTPAAPADPLGNPPYWETLTMPLAPQLNGGTSTYQYESPMLITGSPRIGQSRDVAQPGAITTTSGTTFPTLTLGGGGGTFMAADTDGDGIADALYFKLPIGTVGGVTYYAACRIIDNNSAINANTAWSRDYDFTNAAGGFRRDTGQGIAGAGMLNYGFFRSNVGLMEMFPDYVAGANQATPGTSAQMNTGTQSINGYRFNGLNAAADYTPKIWYRDSTGNYQSRSDFGYLSQGDGLEFGLASRLENPGVNYFSPDTGPVTSTGTATFRAFSWADTAALASRFAILNPSASAGDLESVGTLGLLMHATSSGTVSITSKPYQASDTTTWFNDNFNFDGALRMPMRSIVVSRNPVSNLAPFPHGPYDWNADTIGVATFNGSQAAGGNDPLIPPYLATSATVANNWMPSATKIANAPIGMASYTLGTNGVAVNAKTNINSAPFEELWRAFWSVMSEPKVTGETYRVGACPPFYPSGDYGMFRSPSRDTRLFTTTAAPTPLTSQFKPTASNMMQLRSALAAVNAMDLRDGDDDVTSREVPIYDMTGGAATFRCRARVFGNERQPFITKVYVNTYSDVQSTASALKNTKGYVAVELYNPYPTPMQLNRWAIGVIYRQGTTTAGSSYAQGGLDAGLHITRLSPRTLPMPIGTFDEHYLNQIDRVNGTTTPAQVVIPANGYALLENYLGPTLAAKFGATPNDAQWRASNGRIQPLADTLGTGPLAKIAYVYVPNLSDVIQGVAGSNTGGELMLLRPRRADGTLTATVNAGGTLVDPKDANNVYHEATFSSPSIPNLPDFVPVDSFDFSGLLQTAPGAGAVFQSWFYVRDNLDPWKFVYPNTYDVTKGVAGSALPRQNGTQTSSFVQIANEIGPAITFGFASTYIPTAGLPGAFGSQFNGIQLQNVDWGKNSTYNRWPAMTAASKVSPIGFPAPPLTGGAYEFPFGGFARNGDMMMVPFIGAYEILDQGFSDTKYSSDPTVAPQQTPNPSAFYEFTPITMDCSFADDCTRVDNTQRASYSDPSAADTYGTGDDADEQIGRFCPIQQATGTVQDLNTISGMNYATAPSGAIWKYHFATRLFDYLTVQGGSDDYMPMADPNARDPVGNPPMVPGNAVPAVPDPPTVTNYPDTTMVAPVYGKYPIAATPVAVQNTVSTTPAADHRSTTPGVPGCENRLSVDGLVNINTAPWYVLAQLPLLPPSAAGTPVNANGIPPNIELLAKQIVKYRETASTTSGPLPFTTIFDLNALYTNPNWMPTDSRTGQPMVQSSTAGAPTDVAGGNDWDISTTVNNNLGVQAGNDFEKRFLMLTHISNLITTRSDSFTVYIVVDGFRNAGTADPQLVVHRRAAMIVDRSGMTPELDRDVPNRMNVFTQ